MNSASQIRKTGEGLRLNVIGDQQCLKLTGKDTNQQFTLIEQTNEPGTGIPRHVHAHEDEVFQVVAGTVEFEVSGALQVLGAGELVYLPRGTAHSFKVVGSTTATVLLSIFPAGIEGMFEELGKLPAGPPDFAQVAEICGRYGVTFV